MVTATPYCNYLADDPFLFPKYTIFLSANEGYFGMEELFGTKIDSYNLVRENYISQDEFDKFSELMEMPERILYSKFPNIITAYLNLILGGYIRNYQLGLEGNQRQPYSMLIHIDYKKSRHKNIKSHIQQFSKKILKSLENNEENFLVLFNRCYDNLYKSRNKKLNFPNKEEAIEQLYRAVRNEVKTLVINSEEEKSLKYDVNGEMILDTPYTVFIGAYAVTRGVTFKNLISFVFGRHSKSKVMDTSIQQLRILGYRSEDDLCVTRMYATIDMVKTWSEMFKLDQRFKKNWLEYEKTRSDVHLKEVVNLVKMANPINSKFKLTNPTKSPSNKVKIKADRFIVAKHFDAHRNKKKASKYLNKNRRLLKRLAKKYGIKSILNSKATYTTAKLSDAKEILKNSYLSIEGLNGKRIGGYSEMIYVLEKYNDIHIYTKDNRGRSPIRQDEGQKGNYDVQPHSGQDIINARRISNGLPVVLVLIQDSEKSNGFSAPVIWLVLYVPESFSEIVMISK